MSWYEIDIKHRSRFEIDIKHWYLNPQISTVGNIGFELFNICFSFEFVIYHALIVICSICAIVIFICSICEIVIVNCSIREIVIFTCSLFNLLDSDCNCSICDKVIVTRSICEIVIVTYSILCCHSWEARSSYRTVTAHPQL